MEERILRLRCIVFHQLDKARSASIKGRKRWRIRAFPASQNFKN